MTVLSSLSIRLLWFHIIYKDHDISPCCKTISFIHTTNSGSFYTFEMTNYISEIFQRPTRLKWNKLLAAFMYSFMASNFIHLIHKSICFESINLIIIRTFLSIFTINNWVSMTSFHSKILTLRLTSQKGALIARKIFQTD